MQPEAEVAHLAEAVIKRHQGSSGTHQGSSGTHQAHLAEAVIKHYQGSSGTHQWSSGTHQGSSGTHQAHLAEAARVEEQILRLEIAVDDLMRETISGRQRRRRSG